MIPTEDEAIAIERIGAALKARRRLQGLRPRGAAGACGVSENLWRNLEGGHPGSKLVALLHALKCLGVEPSWVAQWIERAILHGLNPQAVHKVSMTREKRGRPKKEREAVSEPRSPVVG